MPLLPSTSRWPKHTHTCKAYLETPTHLATLIGCWLCVDGTVLKVVSIANYGHYHHCNISHICRSTSVPHTRTVRSTIGAQQQQHPAHPSIQSFTFCFSSSLFDDRCPEQRQNSSGSTVLNLLHQCASVFEKWILFFQPTAYI